MILDRSIYLYMMIKMMMTKCFAKLQKWKAIPTLLKTKYIRCQKNFNKNKKKTAL